MDRKHFLTAMVAVVFSGAALAEPGPDRRPDPRPHGGQAHAQQNARPGHAPSHNDRRPQPRYRRVDSQRLAHGQLRRGRPMPPHYRQSRYVVRDYRTYALTPPPRGYHWVHADNTFILAAIASGVVASIVLSR